MGCSATVDMIVSNQSQATKRSQQSNQSQPEDEGEESHDSAANWGKHMFNWESDPLKLPWSNWSKLTIAECSAALVLCMATGVFIGISHSWLKCVVRAGCVCLRLFLLLTPPKREKQHTTLLSSLKKRIKAELRSVCASHASHFPVGTTTMACTDLCRYHPLEHRPGPQNQYNNLWGVSQIRPQWQPPHAVAVLSLIHI